MADVKQCIASPINDFEGFLHIFYCRIKNFTESLTEKLLRQVGWQGRVQNNWNLPDNVRSPDCRVLTQTYLPNCFSSRFWRAVVSFTAMYIYYVYPAMSKSSKQMPIVNEEKEQIRTSTFIFCCHIFLSDCSWVKTLIFMFCCCHGFYFALNKNLSCLVESMTITVSYTIYLCTYFFYIS